MSDPIVEINHLTHAYGERVAVNDLSLTVSRGEIFGFLGPNGSGKTTLFRILSTLIPAPPGAVKMFGLDAAEAMNAIRNRIGVVFQSPSLDKQLTAAENLRHHGHLYGIHGPELDERMRTLLQRVDLLDRQHERVEGFSGGMRRRVELAKGLLNRPEILLLDEPSTGLDPGARIDLWRMLRDIQASGVTILLTTHLMDEADRCSRLAIMTAGKLVACDTPTAMKERIGGDVITITSNDPERLRSTLRERLNVEAETVDAALRLERPRGHEFVPQLIEAAPGLVESVSVGKPTLEDVFLHLTGKRFRDEEANADSAAQHRTPRRRAG
ncbi:MAG TPA: ATP-binding cassette domain-containing protein [Tepidisphaeraceae bacterium]|nr:ATP-binding cassette domain-containing protein [Tepidisphaeraceae bacterium]